jgi:predicted enzyme related to lactoylglutathione lyase
VNEQDGQLDDHFEIPAANVEKLKQFYAGLFNGILQSILGRWSTG